MRRLLLSPFGRLDPRREDGIALVLAIAVMAFLSAATATALYMATSSRTTATSSNAQQDAYALAQAGLNDALSVLNGQLDTNGAVRAGGKDPRTVTNLLSAQTVSYPALGGSVTYSGALATAPDGSGGTTYTWNITSTGSIKRQNTSTPITRTLTQKAAVVGDPGSWSRFYQDDTSPNECLTLDTTAWVTNIASKGCLVLKNGATISGNVKVDVGTTVNIWGPLTTGGPRSPTAAAGWTNSSNALTNNSVYATNSVPLSGTGANLDVTGLGFSLPTTAYINGISVDIERYATPLNQVETISQSGTPNGTTPTFAISVCNTHTSTSSMIAYNATAATVASAINTACGAGYVACTGGPLHTSVVTCTFSSTSSLTAMTTYQTSSGWTSNKPTYAKLQTGGGVTLKDGSVYLLKSGSVPGGETNHFSASAWPTSAAAATYGNNGDMWGATWTPADVNASTFGVRLAVTNTSAYTAETANVDYVTVTVYYTPVPAQGIGTPSTPVAQLNVGQTCQLNYNAAHSPCTSADLTYATKVTMTAAADNTALTMPAVDFAYWYQNARPGPKHFCTNPNPGITSSFFDNDSTMNGSLTVNGEMAGNTNSDPQRAGANWTYDSITPSINYDCEVWSGGGTSGTLLGEIAWNHTTHVMNIKGTVFMDGSFRFDNDGQVVHYFGRGDLISSREDEIDSVVCAGWSPGGTNTTDVSHSCINGNMANWDPTSNMMVLMADTAAAWNSSDQCGNSGEFPSDIANAGCEEYDQGGTACSGNTPPTCIYGLRPSGFQGVMYSNSICIIHQGFMDSGPVICHRIYIPHGENADATFYTFPYTGNLTDGQQYIDAATAANLAITPGQVNG